jgi:hypothetical protein
MTALDPRGIAAFLLVNAGLALLMRQSPQVATLHALATLATGIWWAAAGQVERVVYVGGYIMGAEALWRLSDARIFWEFGKYATTAVFLIALVRHGRLRPPPLPLLYMMLLLPSASLTLAAVDQGVARDQLSFNLSGPLALGVSGWFFSQLKLSRQALQRLYVAVIGPVAGIAAVTFLATAQASDIVFLDSSNLVTSAGFGPNQVSAALGLGALLCLLHFFSAGTGRSVRVLMVGLLVFFAIESLLTFSRGGIYCAAAGVAIASLVLLKNADVRVKLIPTMALVFIIANFFLVPYLEAFTGGALSARFRDTTLTGRDEFIRADLEVWKAHPVWGVGPGQASSFRGSFKALGPMAPIARSLPGEGAAAHTEFSRMLAEHGLFGLAALTLLVIAAGRNVVRARSALGKGTVAALTVWSVLFMCGYAMRLVAPSLLFGLGFATIGAQEDERGGQ